VTCAVFWRNALHERDDKPLAPLCHNVISRESAGCLLKKVENRLALSVLSEREQNKMPVLFLSHSQQAERVPQADISLIVLAPSVNEAVRDELRCLGWQISQHEAGVHRITGGPFTMWLIETDVMAELGQPVFSLVSRVFLKEHERIIEQLTRTGHGMLLCYTLQQIEQFRSLGEEFVMQHADTEYMGELEEELQTAVLETIPVEKRLRGLSPEEIFRRFSPREVLRRFTPEEFVGGLSDEQAARLRELLERRQAK